jgi:ribosomal protein S18 acetylase RimI-like enzyme
MKHETISDPKTFKLMYEAVFGVPYTHDKVPEIIMMATDDNSSVVGFMSGFWNYDDSFYIQYAGVVPEYRKKGYTQYLNQMLEDGINYICVTENDNVPAMTTLLKIGFIPIGIRQGGKRECFIEWARRA